MLHVGFLHAENYRIIGGQVYQRREISLKKKTHLQNKLRNCSVWAQIG